MIHLNRIPKPPCIWWGLTPPTRVTPELWWIDWIDLRPSRSVVIAAWDLPSAICEPWCWKMNPNICQNKITQFDRQIYCEYSICGAYGKWNPNIIGGHWGNGFDGWNPHKTEILPLGQLWQSHTKHRPIPGPLLAQDLALRKETYLYSYNML